ncbi:MAG TPA: trehalose-phosphatase [Dermatophilaceae bacterium]|nr:trehalose-phosphatase [Dermatophilaceae bacterium]
MIEEHLQALLTRAAQTPAVVLASDFDGTLAPFRLDPMAVRPLPAAMAALRQAAGQAGVTVALVSGRDLGTLRSLSAVDVEEAIVLVGSHGAESSLPDDPSAPPTGLTADQRALLGDVEAALEAICRRYPGAWIERKTTARALHTRPLAQADSDAALAEALAAAAAFPQIHVLTGKCVVELPVVEANKGTALRMLATARSAEATVYFGDDVTDERAFVALDPGAGDVTVKVGDGHTSAIARVPAIADVIECLELFVQVRAAATAETRQRAGDEQRG